MRKERARVLDILGVGRARSATVSSVALPAADAAAGEVDAAWSCHDSRGRGIARLVRKSAAIVVASVLVAACGASDPDVIGVTRLSGGAPRPIASSSATARPGPSWPSWNASKKWAKASARAFVSEGHLFGRYVAEIVVNDVAAAPYAALAPGAMLPRGAIVAEVMSTPGGAPGPTFAMERGEAGWSFVELSETGQELRRGALEPCASCHGEVQSQDALFGVPTTGR